MATPRSRLKELVRKLDIRSYEYLLLYVLMNCGEKLRDAVIDNERDLRRYIDARSVAREEQHPYIYRKPTR